jgi:ArsR family transcriptional regulator
MPSEARRSSSIMSKSSKVPAPLNWLATLGDLARVRVLRLLEGRELSVGELAKAMQLPQSTVSRHLKLLLDRRWVTKRTEGTASLYRMANDQLDQGARELWAVTRKQLGDVATLREDDARLDAVLSQRRTDSKAFFGRIGGDWDKLRRELFGAAFTGEAMLDLLDPAWVVADIGCGTGNATEVLAPVVRKVIAVDREPAMLEAARDRLATLKNVEFREGDLHELPINDGEVDAAISFLVLVYVQRPSQAVVEMARIVRPGGAVMIVDLVPHDRESYRDTMGHLHLGFDEKQVKLWARSAGLKEVRYRRLRPDTSSKGPGLFVATMRRPA